MDLQLIGDSCVSLLFGDDISLSNSRKVLTAYHQLKRSRLLGELKIHDLVPTYRSLAVHFEPGQDPAAVGKSLVEILARDVTIADAALIQPSKTVEIPVVYDGVDLARVAKLNGLQPKDVIRLHAGVLYPVAMIGFKPYFPYLIGLDPRLETPRLKSPRTRVPAGSVAIGGAQTGVYPEESPGGWNLIGRMSPELLRVVLPGDNMVFIQCEEL
jgi:KipI family sensor histidine kinase inhibitor